MIRRTIETEFLTLLGEFPVVTVLGPRQAGKTTLVRSLLKDYIYVNLENPELRQLAEEDPKQFLARKFLVYDGEEMDFSDGVKALSFQKMEEILGAHLE